MLHDLKAACRGLLNAPWLTSIIVLTLALGIGANTAIFSVANRLLLNPLPYADAGRIVHLRLGSERFAFGYPTPNFVARAWHDDARSVDGVEAFELRDMLGYDDLGSRVLLGMKATPGLPTFLHVQPVLGRAFTADDAQPAAAPVALLSYEMWQRDYGGAAEVLGRTITLDAVTHVVIGVMPAHADAIAGPIGMDVWLPLSLAAFIAPRGVNAVEAVARLRPEIPLSQVTDELNALATQARDAAGQVRLGDLFVRIVSPVELLNRPGANAKDMLLVLLGAVGLLLLVACANVANLLLARGTSRSRALALRAALGASRLRLVRGLLAECSLLALAAGITGIAIGWTALAALVRIRPGNLVALDDVRLDPLVLGFTLLLSVITALVFGIAPVLQLTATRFGDVLRQGGTGVVRGGGKRLRKLLVAVQMAVSVVLLVAAGLLGRTYYYLQNVDVGFDTQDLVTFQLALPRARYENPESRDLVAERLLERIRALPGVVAATQAFLAPPNSLQTDSSLEIRGVTLPEADARAPYAFNFVRDNYFATLRMRLLQGRTFTADELRTGGGLIVNRAAAERYWPDGNAIGGEVKYSGGWATVVGVVDNVAAAGALMPRDVPLLYWPFRAELAPTLIGATPNVVLIVRTSADSTAAIAQIRAATLALDPEIALRTVQTMDAALAGVIGGPRFNMALLGAFAVIAMVLAAVGLAAVIGYEINERTREIGIRFALGARAENVRRFAMRHGLTPALVGLAVGIVGAFAAATVTTSLLHGVTPRDPATFVAVALLLLFVGVAAAQVAARRAARIDAMSVLRGD
jgi:putative ABC transport system permease protein